MSKDMSERPCVPVSPGDGLSPHAVAALAALHSMHGVAQRSIAFALHHKEVSRARSWESSPAVVQQRSATAFSYNATGTHDGSVGASDRLATHPRLVRETTWVRVERPLQAVTCAELKSHAPPRNLIAAVSLAHWRGDSFMRYFHVCTGSCLPYVLY